MPNQAVNREELQKWDDRLRQYAPAQFHQHPRDTERHIDEFAKTHREALAMAVTISAAMGRLREIDSYLHSKTQQNIQFLLDLAEEVHRGYNVFRDSLNDHGSTVDAKTRIDSDRSRLASLEDEFRRNIAWIDAHVAMSLTSDDLERREKAARLLEVTLAERDQQSGDILKRMQDASFKVASIKSLEDFESIRREHKSREDFWATLLAIAAVMTLACAAVVIAGALPRTGSSVSATLDPATSAGSAWAVDIPYLFRNVLLLSLPLIFFRVCLKQFSLERNLSIIFDHRIAVLRRLDVALDGVRDDDFGSREKLRLVMFQALFADPRTGFGDDSSADVNISPVMNLMDSAFPKSKT